MGGRYPSLSPCSQGYVRPSRTSRVLQPGTVLATLVILLLCCVIGTGVGISVFKGNKIEELSPCVKASQTFMLMSCSASAIYIMLHSVASFYNEPIGEARPPERKLHAGCVIVVKVALVLWIVGIIAAAVVVGKTDRSFEGSTEDRLYVLDLVAANLAFLSIGILLTALEACQYPFEIPEQFTTGITCRVSSFGDDLLDRSISSASSSRSNVPAQGKSTPVIQQPSLRRSNSIKRSIPGEYPDERRLTPLLPMLPMIPVSQSQSWGDEWKRLMSDTSKESVVNKKEDKADSAISMGSETSSEYTHKSDSTQSKAKPPRRPKAAVPSSNISDHSRRSPLSRMRSAEFPHIVVQPQMRFMPLVIPPQYEWNSTRLTHLNKLPPGVNHTTPQRRSSLTGTNPLLNRHASVSGGLVSRTYIDYRPSLDDERRLEEHTKEVEAELVARTPSGQQPAGPVRIPAGPFEQLYASNPLNSKVRYRDNRPTGGSRYT